MDHYSALERNELLSHKKTWDKCKCISLSERSQSEKATCCMIPTYDVMEKANYGDSKKISDCH